MNKNKRSRNWVLTKNYKDKQPQDDNELLNYIKNINGAVFTVFQLEQGESGTKHHQLYISFKDAKSFKTIKKLFPTAHFEPMLGTPKQAFDYCTKEDTRITPPVEWGELPKQGKRSDLDRIYNMIIDGFTDSEIRDSFPSQYIRYRRHLQDIRQEIQEETVDKEFLTSNREVQCLYIAGKSRVGKSTFLDDFFEVGKYYSVTDYKHMWDNYNGEEIVVFDEFQSSNVKLAEMLRYLQGRPTILGARYRNKIAKWFTVVIVSNKRICDQYYATQEHNEEMVTAFINRFKYSGGYYWIATREQMNEFRKRYGLGEHVENKVIKHRGTPVINKITITTDVEFDKLLKGDIYDNYTSNRKV